MDTPECEQLKGNADSGEVVKYGLGNRLRSHIKSDAETTKHNALAACSQGNPSKLGLKNKNNFLSNITEKWANEEGRILMYKLVAVKKSRSKK